jgi:hypothetical protein
LPDVSVAARVPPASGVSSDSAGLNFSRSPTTELIGNDKSLLVQRIREAMASTFAKAGPQFDPRDVLRSCPAEGTNKVLYRILADVRRHHLSHQSEKALASRNNLPILN